MAWYQPVAPPETLTRVLACSWTARPQGEHRLVPDGCADLLWLSNGAMILCGPEERPWTFELPRELVAVGVRFRPGALSRLLDFDVSTIRDRRLPWSEFVTPENAAEVSHAIAHAASRDLADGRRVLEASIEALATPTGRTNDPLAEQVLDALTSSPEIPQVSLARRLGLSPRQLHRRALRLLATARARSLASSDCNGCWRWHRRRHGHCHWLRWPSLLDTPISRIWRATVGLSLDSRRWRFWLNISRPFPTCPIRSRRRPRSLPRW